MNELPCDFCGVCVIQTGEMYVVTDDVWAQAVRDGEFENLCVGCLESRLFRKLTPADFTHCILNLPTTTNSARLNDRLTTHENSRSPAILPMEGTGQLRILCERYFLGHMADVSHTHAAIVSLLKRTGSDCKATTRSVD